MPNNSGIKRWGYCVNINRKWLENVPNGLKDGKFRLKCLKNGLNWAKNEIFAVKKPYFLLKTRLNLIFIEL